MNHRATLLAAALVVFVVLAGVGATTATAETPDKPDLQCVAEDNPTPYETDSGLLVYEDDDEGTIDEFFFPESDTVRFAYEEGAVEFTGHASAELRLDSGTGDVICLAAVDTDDDTIEISPDGAGDVELAGAFDGFAFRDVVTDPDEETADFAYDASEIEAITIEVSFDDGSQIEAIDVDNEAQLDTTEVTDGTVTFDSLPVGAFDVRIKEVDDEPSTTRSGSSSRSDPLPDGVTWRTTFQISDDAPSEPGTTVSLSTAGQFERLLTEVKFDSDGVTGLMTVSEYDQLPADTPALDADKPFVGAVGIDVPEEFADEPATIEFQITTGQLDEAGVDPDTDDIVLLHATENAEEFETLEADIEQVDGGIIGTAKTPNFSVFVVSTADDVEDNGHVDDVDAVPESSDDESEETDDGIPGFGVTVALVALIALASLAKRRTL